jgi:hypothetical protein
MLNIFKTKQKNFNDKSLNNNNTNSINIKEENFIILNKVDKNEYKNLIFYPSSTKEWFNSVYSYNKSYIKSLIAIDVTANILFASYFNMLENKIKVLFKRRRHNKSRYSANKLYVYNKQKASVQRYVRKHIDFTTVKEYLVQDKIVEKLTQKNRLTHLLKKQFFIFKKFNTAFVKKTDNLLKSIVSNVKFQLDFYKIPVFYIILLKRLSRVQLLIFNAVDMINFNTSKFNTLMLN